MNAKPQSDTVQKRLETLGRLIDGGPVILFLWRIEPARWPVDVVSANVQSLLGYSSDDFTSGRVSWPGMTHPEDVPRLEQQVKDLLAAGHDQWSQQYRLITKDERILWVEDWNRVLRDADGKATHIQALVIDITERKGAAEALRQSEERYRTLFESSRDAIMTLEPPSWRFTSGNPATVSMFKAASEKDFTAHEPWTLSPDRQPDGRPSAEKAAEIIGKAMREGSHFFEWRHVRIGGEEFPATVLLTRVEAGGKTFLQATVRDITDLTRVEDALHQSEERYRTAFQNAAEGILVADIETRQFRHANPAICRLLGYSEDELKQRTVYDIHPRDALEHVISEFQAQARGEKTLAMDIPCLRKDGTTIYADINTTKVILDGRECNIGFFTDITLRKQLQEAVVATTKAERERVRRDLHDGISQQLMGLRLLLDSLRQDLSATHPEAAARAAHIEQIAGDALIAVRQLAVGLEPLSEEPDALVMALQRLASRVNDLYRIQCRVTLCKPVLIHNPDTANHLYLIAQEAVSNAVKHAKPSKIAISLSKRNSTLRLVVRDNGVGFSHKKQSRGMGMGIMQTRATLIGASFDVQAGKEGGTVVTCSRKETPPKEQQRRR